MHKTYKNLADLLLNCESAQRFYNNLPLHSKLELKEKGSHLQTEDALRSLAKTISEQYFFYKISPLLEKRGLFSMKFF